MLRFYIHFKPKYIVLQKNKSNLVPNYQNVLAIK